MKIGPTPRNQKERLEVIRNYHILDTEDEQEYNDIVELATQICVTPIGIITLLDDKRQWFKAKKGLDLRATDIAISFCAHTIHEDGIMIVRDSHEDDRFIGNPLVTGKPYVRFYAGIPLSSREGFKLGSLAVMDTKTRELSADQVRCLKILARQVEQLLTLRIRNFELSADLTGQSNLLSDILNRISDGFIAVDNHWTITFANEKAAELTKRKAKEITGKNLWTEFPEALASSLLPLAEQAFQSQQVQHNEEFFQPYGLWMEGHLYPSESGLSIYFRDVSTRKHFESALRESEAYYRNLFEANPQPMWIYDVNTLAILDVNEAAVQKYGYSKEEFLKLNIFDLRSEEEAERLNAWITAGNAFAKEFTTSGPWTHKLKSGETIHVEVASHQVQWNGRTARLTLAWDISKRVHMERSLRMAEEQYRTIFENAFEGIYRSSPEGKFITVNPAMAKMFGYSTPEELISSVTDMSHQLYVEPAQRDAARKLIEETGNVQGVEFRMFKKDGSVIWVHANVRGIKDEHNRLRYFEGTMQDVTDQKEAEEKLRLQFEELQKTNQELDRFVYSASHDLRAPLATILGLLNLAELESPSQTFNEYLKMIGLNIRRLDGFINDILDYSVNARKEVQVEQIDFHNLIGEILKNFHFIASADRLKMHLEIDNAHSFYSDSYRISIILNNLLSNSIKYQDFAKKESYVSLKVVTSEHKATIIFSDNGIGIKSEHLDKIFNMFYRASENAKGSGLGLYITKETVVKLGGEISVHSDYEKYTTFNIQIPNLHASLR